MEEVAIVRVLGFARGVRASDRDLWGRAGKAEAIGCFQKSGVSRFHWISENRIPCGSLGNAGFCEVLKERFLLPAVHISVVFSFREQRGPVIRKLSYVSLPYKDYRMVCHGFSITLSTPERLTTLQRARVHYRHTSL
jgi:hypothetical protein